MHCAYILFVFHVKDTNVPTILCIAHTHIMKHFIRLLIRFHCCLFPQKTRMFLQNYALRILLHIMKHFAPTKLCIAHTHIMKHFMSSDSISLLLIPTEDTNVPTIAYYETFYSTSDSISLLLIPTEDTNVPTKLCIAYTHIMKHFIRLLIRFHCCLFPQKTRMFLHYYALRIRIL